MEREQVEKFAPRRQCAHGELEMKPNIPLCLTITNDIIKISYAHLVMIIHTG